MISPAGLARADAARSLGHRLELGPVAGLRGTPFDPDGAIKPAGVDRVVEAVNRAMNEARRLGVQQLYVFTTSAVRHAANRDLILDRVEAEAGVRPQYLSGVDEARLIYLAVHQWYGWSAGRLLILDIGGGSMEIVLGRDAEPELAMSLPLGAGRLTRLFLPDDPPSRNQLAALRRHANGTLREVADRPGSPSPLRDDPAHLVRAAVLALWHLPQRAQCLLVGLVAPGQVHELLLGGRIADAAEEPVHLDKVGQSHREKLLPPPRCFSRPGIPHAPARCPHIAGSNGRSTV